MGFRKQGISIMLLFWSIFALGAGIGMDWLLMFTPVIWLYSFFNVHNLKSLSEEEFYSLEDSYVLHFEEFIGDTNTIFRKYRTLVAVLLIVFGFSILWNNFSNILYWVLPGFLGDMVSEISYRLPQIIIAIAIIMAGFYILSDKKHHLKDKEHNENPREHYWEPYRPFQQSNEPEPHTTEGQRRPVQNYPEQNPQEPGRRPFQESEAPGTYRPFRDSETPDNHRNADIQPPAFPADQAQAPAADTQENTTQAADVYPPYPEEELNKDENA